MPTFSPPVTPGGTARANPWGTAAGDRLMRHYGENPTGATIWQDQDLTWHEGHYPYAGRPDSPGLLQARRVYLGGHVHQIDVIQLVELAGAGYFDYVNIEDVEIPGWKTEHLSKLTRSRISTPGDGAVPRIPPLINGAEQLVLQNAAGPTGTSGGQRDVWLHSDVLYENIEAEVYLDAPGYGQGAGSAQFLQQIGLVLRHNTTAGEQRMVAINNNVFGVIPVINIGVWKSALDGSTMSNRQTNLGFPALFNPSWPIELGVRLDDNIVRVRVRKPNTAWPPWVDDRTSHTHSQAINLDTEAGDAVAIPTPVGRGQAGLIGNHLGTVPEGLFGRTVFRNRSYPGRVNPS